MAEDIQRVLEQHKRHQAELATRVRAECQGLDDEGLLDVAQKHLATAATNADDLTCQSEILAILRERGMLPEDRRIKRLNDILLRIHDGSTLAEIVWRFLGMPRILPKAAALPLYDQARLLSNDPIEVVVLRKR